MRLEDSCKDVFSYQVVERGIKYFEDNKVLCVYHSDNSYFSSVEGSDSEPYYVDININENIIEMHCTCPCEFPCKHEYATFLMIANKKFKEVTLLDKIEKKEDSLDEVIARIPSEELKKYFSVHHAVLPESPEFMKAFIKYFNIAPYEYYYNNYYNSLVLERDTEFNVYCYLKEAKEYIDVKEYHQAFIIIKALIDATFAVNDEVAIDDLIVEIASISMYLRISYRNASKTFKKEMNEFFEKIEKNKFYHNDYIEDMFYMAKQVSEEII